MGLYSVFLSLLAKSPQFQSRLFVIDNMSSSVLALTGVVMLQYLWWDIFQSRLMGPTVVGVTLCEDSLW